MQNGGNSWLFHEKTVTLQPLTTLNDMGFFKLLFGGQDATPEEERQGADSRNFDLLKYDGVKALRMGQADYAAKCFREALKIHDDLEVRDYLSQALIRTGELADALRELKLIAAAQPQNMAAYVQAAHVAYMMEDYAEQQAICEQALQVDDTFAPLWQQYALAARGQGRLDEAVAHLTKAIELDDQLADARLLRGQVLLQKGDTAGATADADWLNDFVGEHEDVLLLQARIAHAEGRDDDAISIYNKVNDLNPFQLDAFRERGRIYYDRGDSAAAEDEMRKLLELNPSELGDGEPESVEKMMQRAYQPINPFGI